MTWRQWGPDVGVGLLVLLAGLLEVANLPAWYGDDPRPAGAAGEVAGSAPSDEVECPPNQPGGDVVDGGGE